MGGGGNSGMSRRGSGCFSLLAVAALLLRDLVLLKEDDRGGNTGSEVSSMVFFVLLDLRSESEHKFTLEDEAEGKDSLTTGSLGALVLTLAGIGTVLDRLFEVECAS